MRFVLYALLILLLLRAVGRFLGGMVQGMGGAPRRAPGADGGVRMVRDPICGTFVVPGKSLAVRDGAAMHHFCSEKCRSAFMARQGR